MSLTTFNSSVNNMNIQWQTGRIANITLVNDQAYAIIAKDPEWTYDSKLMDDNAEYFNQFSSTNSNENLLEALLIPLVNLDPGVPGSLERLKNRSVTVQVVKYDSPDIEVATTATLTPEHIIKKDERLLIERTLLYGDNDVKYLSEEHLGRIVAWGGSSELIDKLKKATKFTEDAFEKFILTPINNMDTIYGYKRSLKEEEIDDIAFDFEAGFIQPGEVYSIKSALCHLPIRAMGGK